MDYSINIVLVDYKNPKHLEDLVTQLITYSGDIMGGGSCLPRETAEQSVRLLREKTYAFSVLAYDGDKAIGFANCFESIATFAGQCAANIHDLAVIEDYRDMGIGRALLTAIETHAKKMGYYKLTLEVLEGNTPAKSLYQSFGFESYALDPTVGTAEFWQKVLADEKPVSIHAEGSADAAGSGDDA